MTDSGQPPDLHVIQTASALAFEKLTEAIGEFSAACTEWDNDGRRLTQTTLDRVESLTDPAYGELRKQIAADLTDELERLPEAGEPLVPEVNSLLLALQIALWDLAMQIMQMMRTVVEGGALNDFTEAYLAVVAAVKAEFENPASAQGEGGADLDAALARAMSLEPAVTEPVHSYAVWMAGAIIAIDDVSGALRVAAMLLTARLNLLVEFLDRTDPPAMATDVPRGRFVRTFIKAGVSEAAAESLKQVIEFGIEEVAKEIAKPLTVGLSVLWGISQRLREKRMALQQERANLEKLAQLQAGPGPSDYMYMLRGDFRKGETEISELVGIIREFAERLQAGLAPGSTE